MQKIKKIIVVGADEVALLVAATLSFNLRHVEVVVVDGAPKISSGLVESSMENIGAFLNLAGIDIDHFISRTNATVNLGNKFQDWSTAGQQFTHCFGDCGVAFGGTEFHQILVRFAKEGKPEKISDFSLTAAFVETGKKFPQDYHSGEGLPQVASGLNFSIHAFTTFLVAHLQRLGVKRTAENVIKVNLADDGRISSLITNTGRVITADFYIDCSGSSSQLLGEAMGVDYVSWQNTLIANRKLCAIEPAHEVISSLADIVATKKGWLRRVRLKDFTALELYYRAENYTDEQARAEIKSYLNSEQVKYFDATPFLSGKRARSWEKNCLAIGASAVCSAQFSHSALFIAQAAVARFLDYFPSQEPVAELIDEYNRITHNEIDRIYDYHCLHCLLLNEAHPLAINNKSLLTPALIHKLEVFQSSGRLIKYEGDNIESSQWVSLLLGMGILPDRYDPLVDNFSSEQLHQKSQLLAEYIKRVVSAMPS